MTYDQLEMLEKIVEKGSFKAAAEALYKTQPSLSVAIKKLEEEFDLLIFNRDEYRPKLTDQGRVFYGWAKQCLRSFRELEVVGKELGTNKSEPHLVMVVDPLVRFEAIEGIFDECLAWPKVSDVTFRSDVLGGGMQRLLDGDADFAIAPKVAEHEHIESIPFERVEMVPVVSKSLIKRGEVIDILWLQRQRQIVVQSAGEKDLIKRESMGVMTQGQKCFVTDHGLKYKLITRGFGWGRLMLEEIRTELRKGTLVQIDHEAAQSFTLDLHIMRSRLKPLGPIGRLVWEHLQKRASLAPARRKAKLKNPSS